MGRRRKGGIHIHGWLNIDKPVGMSSAACVGVVRKALNANRVGHAGTLDPLASGVLPVALGEATKTVSILQNGRKRYRFTLHWGERRTTDDAEGEIVATSDHRPDAAAIEAALPEFIGSVSQIPPAFSAVKIDGERAYARARGGETVTLDPRIVEIHELRFLGAPEDASAEGSSANGADLGLFEVTCGKGMYVRSLARDLAVALGTEGHLSRLVREAVGPFELTAAISLAKIEQLGHSAADFEEILPITTALADIPALALSVEEASRLRNGQAVPIMRPADRDILDEMEEDDPILAIEADGDTDTPVALVRADGIRILPVRVFNM